jgi:hypothetical protein
MISIRIAILLPLILCLAACASVDGGTGSLASTDAFVHKQLDRRGL